MTRFSELLFDGSTRARGCSDRSTCTKKILNSFLRLRPATVILSVPRHYLKVFMINNRRSLLSAIAAVLSVVALTACQPTSPPSGNYALVPGAAPAPAPVVVQAAAPSSGVGDMLMGAAVGGLAVHALTGGNRAPSAAPPSTSSTTINKTVVHKTIVVHAPPVSAPQAAKAFAPPAVSLAKASAPASVTLPIAAPMKANYAAKSPYGAITTRVSYTGSAGRK